MGTHAIVSTRAALKRGSLKRDEINPEDGSSTEKNSCNEEEPERLPKCDGFHVEYLRHRGIPEPLKQGDDDPEYNRDQQRYQHK